MALCNGVLYTMVCIIDHKNGGRSSPDVAYWTAYHGVQGSNTLMDICMFPH